MAIHKVIEVSAQSTESFEDAVRIAVKDAGKSVKNIRSVYVKEQLAEVSGDTVSAFRAICKITFEVEG
ncbi:MAG: dodecin family protein [Spirochaetota bacterium]